MNVVAIGWPEPAVKNAHTGTHTHKKRFFVNYERALFVYLPVLPP